jgi:hypothetical protein
MCEKFSGICRNEGDALDAVPEMQSDGVVSCVKFVVVPFPMLLP